MLTLESEMNVGHKGLRLADNIKISKLKEYASLRCFSSFFIGVMNYNMNKSQAINILCKCALNFSNHLENRHYLILASKGESKSFIEIDFNRSQFMHLSGVVPNKLSAAQFYNKCLGKTLNTSDFEFRTNGTTVLKLVVLERVLNITHNVKMIGDFDTGQRIKLYCEKLIGGTNMCLGLIKKGNYYIPVTVLKDDIRILVCEVNRVITILSKKKSDMLYSQIEYTAKGIELSVELFPQTIHDKISI